MTNRALLPTLLLLLTACGGRGAETAAPSSPSAAGAAFEALPDTMICVVDRTTERGLRNLAAKRGTGGEVLLRVSGEVLPLERVHPVGVVAGYAGNESWVTAGEAIRVQERRFVAVPGERRVGLEQLKQAGEYRAIPVFADPNDAAPLDAVYLPSRPGCVFRAYVREDLSRGSR